MSVLNGGGGLRRNIAQNNERKMNPRWHASSQRLTAAATIYGSRLGASVAPSRPPRAGVESVDLEARSVRPRLPGWTRRFPPGTTCGRMLPVLVEWR